MARITAVIDIGSNSARMAVFKRTSRFGFHLIREVKSRVRISEDSYENSGYLQVEPMLRAQKAIKEFVNVAKALKARKILCVATSAVRDAPNKNEFINKISKECGINIKVIDGQKEAYFGAVAALNLLPIKDAITIDIGGGSTECAYIKNGKIESLFSLNLGTVRIKELFYDRKRPVSDAIEFIKNEMQKLPKDLRCNTVVGIGGTIRALSKSIMKKNNYIIDALHGFEYDLKDELDTFQKIAYSTVLRLKRFNIKDERFDTIREGALIFWMLLNFFEAKRVVTSGVGVREGVFLTDILRNTNHKFPPEFNPSVRSLIDRYCCDEASSNYRQKLALALFDELRELHKIDDSYKFHLKYAAKLLKIGIDLGYYDHQAHGSYIVKNGLLYGFTHKDRLIIAFLIGFNNKKVQNWIIPEEMMRMLPDIKTLEWLNFILSLAEAINSDLTKPKIELRYKSGSLTLYTKDELYLAKEAIKKLSKPAPFSILFEKL